MVDHCPTCRLALCPATELWDLGTHCPRTMRFLSRDPFIKLVAERDCLALGIEYRGQQLALCKAQLRGVVARVDEVVAGMPDEEGGHG